MNWNGDKNKITLVFLILVFLIAFMAIAFMKPDDGQTFQTLGGLLTGAFAALVMEMKAAKDAPPPGSTTTLDASQHQTTKTPELPAT